MEAEVFTVAGVVFTVAGVALSMVAGASGASTTEATSAPSTVEDSIVFITGLGASAAHAALADFTVIPAMATATASISALAFGLTGDIHIGMGIHRGGEVTLILIPTAIPILTALTIIRTIPATRQILRTAVRIAPILPATGKCAIIGTKTPVNRTTQRPPRGLQA